MAKAKSSLFTLTQVVVTNFSISREPANQGIFNIDIKPSGLINKTNKDFLLTLEVNIKDNPETFNIDLTVLGYFKFKDIDDDVTLGDYFYTNAPALVFPFIRSYIMSVTALSGLETVVLPIMNLVGLKAELKSNTITAEAEEDNLLLN